MRSAWASIGLGLFMCAAPVRGLHAQQAQTGIVDLGVRLSVLCSLEALNNADLSVSRSADPTEILRNTSDVLRFMRRIKTENLDELLAVYATNAALVLPDGESVDASSLRGWFRSAFDRFTVARNTVRLDPGGVQVIGDHAVVTGFVSTELSDRTRQVTELSVSVDFKLLLVKHEGSWRVLRQTFSVPMGSWAQGN
jgi:hypothetical protein